ncbi:hypothetical protein BCV71DRAFT_239514 [Rhizopus microsporus]|uniref:Uncharacterized protein n=1 Tax=Rhizopus microsporus TaxID=58291 RepID=A0A1X0RMC2_RHIZD|nr:hypothetical protein BCV71DRAFT_239514 [Rhizopus microsporus]
MFTVRSLYKVALVYGTHNLFVYTTICSLCSTSELHPQTFEAIFTIFPRKIPFLKDGIQIIPQMSRHFSIASLSFINGCKSSAPRLRNFFKKKRGKIHLMNFDYDEKRKEKGPLYLIFLYTKFAPSIGDSNDRAFASVFIGWPQSVMNYHSSFPDIYANLQLRYLYGA